MKGGPIVAGVWAAWCTPWAWKRLGELSRPSGALRCAGATRDVSATRDVVRALRWAQRTLALLARLPGGWWRTTCLYRSVAECLTLRAMGVEARIAIAVAQEVVRESAQELVPGPRVVAHAWVENTNGIALGSAAANHDMTPLRPAGATASAASA